MYTPIVLDSITLPAFRAENMFERFADYAAHNMQLDYTFYNERCTVTGEVYGTRQVETLSAILRMVASEVAGSDDADLLNPPTQTDVQNWAQDTLDRIHYRLVLTSRPSPAFAVSNGRMVISHMSQAAQLTALLAELFIDKVNTKAVTYVSSQTYDRICAVFALRDDVDSMLADDQESLKEIHSLLIELDAKYAIGRVKLSATESANRGKLLDSDIVGNVKNLRDFLVSLLNRMDEHATFEDGPARWSQEVYKSGAVDAVKRTSFSNIFSAMQKERAPSNRHIKPAGESKPRNKGGRPVKDHAKAERRARMAAMLKGTFGVQG